MTTLLLISLLSQDLWQRTREELKPKTAPRTSPDRLDLKLGPSVDRSSPLKPGAIDLNLQFLPDLACGRFDFASSFQSVFNKNVREELVGSLVEKARSNIAGSSMVLACQMSPTMCDALKHYRVTTQDFLQMELAQCRTVEQMAGGSDRQMRARAMKDCLEQSQAEGRTLDEAMKLCRDATDLRGLRGQRVREIDLVREVGGALALSSEALGVLQEFLNGLRLKPTGVDGQVKPGTTDDRYGRRRQEIIQALSEAAAPEGRGVFPQDRLDKLAPAGSPPMTRAELQRLAAMEEPDRTIAIHTLASALALSQVVREAGDVQTALAAARAMTTEAALQQAIDQEVRRLDDEVRRLKEAFEMETLVAQTRLRTDAAALNQIVERSRRNTSTWRERDRQAAAAHQTRPWEKSCPTK